MKAITLRLARHRCPYLFNDCTNRQDRGGRGNRWRRISADNLV